jgi:hypothetical protein
VAVVAGGWWLRHLELSVLGSHYEEETFLSHSFCYLDNPKDVWDYGWFGCFHYFCCTLTLVAEYYSELPPVVALLQN